ncbi:MAG: MBL fold metallo-hydrolase [Bacteroidales bacterium]|nr:MBL fold metallo-hydrolase [Bacteroidales bacterium]
MRKWSKLFFIVLTLAVSGPLFAQTDEATIKVRFLGTGAADWHGPDKNGEQRRMSSILVDDSVLVDYTAGAREMLPEGVRPHVILYTHSHGDHYNAEAALRLGIDTVYCSDTWVERCRKDFAAQAAKLALPEPVVIPLKQQEEVSVSSVTFKALPATHYTGDLNEQALMYLLIKDDTRVLYATDTGGIPANAAIGGRFGADGLPKAKRLPLAGFIMEATVGMNGEENFRLFSHSCVETVLHTVRVLWKNGTFPQDRPAYLTHLARTLHPSQEELDKTLPYPLKAAYDGLEVIFPEK